MGLIHTIHFEAGPSVIVTKVQINFSHLHSLYPSIPIKCRQRFQSPTVFNGPIYRQVDHSVYTNAQLMLRNTSTSPVLLFCSRDISMR